jgi:hypothetical protein
LEIISLVEEVLLAGATEGVSAEVETGAFDREVLGTSSSRASVFSTLDTRGSSTRDALPSSIVGG